MTPEQLAEIEQRWNFVKDRKEPLSGLLSECAKEDIASLLQEVRRLNRMVDRAIEKMSEFGCVTDSDPCPGNYIEVGCAECVRKYLESEAAK